MGRYTELVTELNAAGRGPPPPAGGDVDLAPAPPPLLPAPAVPAAASRAAIFPDTAGPSERGLPASDPAEPKRGLLLLTDEPAAANAGMKSAAAAAAPAVPPKLGGITPAAAAASAGLVWKPGGRVRRLTEDAAEWVGLSFRSERAWEVTMVRGSSISPRKFVVCSAGVPSAS